MELFQLEKKRELLRHGAQKKDIREKCGDFDLDVVANETDGPGFTGVSFSYYGDPKTGPSIRLHFFENVCNKIYLFKEPVL